MNIGRRVARLRIAHGESLREAAIRTGVSHSTIARIEKGEVTASFHDTLRKVAEGYQVTLEYLFSGELPNRLNPLPTRRRLSQEERASLLFSPGQERVRRALAMVTSPLWGGISREQFASALGLNLETLEAMVFEQADITEELAERLYDQLSLLTGLSPLWFRWGLADTASAEPESDEWGPYLRLVEKSCQADLQPDLVEMAIELLKLNGTDSIATP